MSRGYTIGVIGATGLVGQEFLRILNEGERPDLPVKGLRLFASERSAGQRVTVRGETYTVEVAKPEPALFAGLDFVLTALDDELAKVYAPAVAAAGALDVDKSNAWRMDPQVPLVIPEVNPDDARHHRGIIAGPNCSTTQLAVALWPLHRHNPIRRIIVDTYQAVSGTGKGAVEELRTQVQDLVAGCQPQAAAYPHQIAHNVIPEIGGLKDGGLYSEELKLIEETRKIFHAPHLAISATCVRVPVMTGHSEAVHVEFERPMSPDEARAILAEAPGVTVVDDPRRSRYPMPLEAAGRDEVFVGRLRADPSHPHGLAMWIVSDNLRKGAALNAVQVFELVARRGWLEGARSTAAVGDESPVAAGD
ncbi:MAG TPA: aspartate-semialdehyde dehydrogenase [Chloroflexota bacterium]|jgi:aspartate-semialdehyde dehydrogenase|nr:aspartate-semialdehyde dehydrogenase [Chloroflexota bacterium]